MIWQLGDASRRSNGLQIGEYGEPGIYIELLLAYRTEEGKWGTNRTVLCDNHLGIEERRCWDTYRTLVLAGGL